MSALVVMQKREGENLVRQKALIVKLGQIGDVIMAIPASRSLYDQGFDIDWVCGQAVKSLLECYSWINVVSVDDKALLAGGVAQRIWNLAKLWKKVAFRNYDLTATLYFDYRYRFLTLPVRASRKFALSRRSRKTTLVLDRNRTDEYTRLLLGAEDGWREQSAPLIRPDRLSLSRWPAKSTPRRIAIVPGGAPNLLRQQISRQPPQILRRWPLENYLSLAQSVAARGWEIVLLGGVDDAWVAPHFSHIAPTNCIGKLSLPEVITFSDTCDAVISNDTGPMHLAGLSTACLIGIFGPTDPHTFLPRRDFAVGIWGGQGFACRPCYDGHDFAPCTFNGCMHQVSPQRVLRELDLLLEARDQGISRPWQIVFPEPTELPRQRSPASAGSSVL